MGFLGSILRRAHTSPNRSISIEIISVGVVGTGPEEMEEMESFDIVVIFVLYEGV
jgi:hypothetical protein